MKFVCHFIPIGLWGTLIILSSITQICSSCVLEERQALLDFKASINETEHTDLILPSWIDDYEYPTAGSDCCSWEGVECSDAAPGRIVKLQLGDLARDFSAGSDIYKFDRIWHANISILASLENLQSLDLSDNHFGSSIFEPCERLAAFKSLKSLNLDWNNMEDNCTLHCLSAISSLKDLSVAENGITSLEESCERLAAFKSLQSLNLDWNHMEDNRTLKCLSAISSLKKLSLVGNGITSLEGCERLANFKNLESLNLDWNRIHNTSLQCITTISSLKYFSMAFHLFEHLFPFKANRRKQLRHILKDLSSNRFSGPLSFEEICSLKNLVVLDLRENSFSGNIPSCLGNLTSLKFLDISYNNFSGNIPTLVITSLVHLESLSLAGNNFEGSFSFGSLANLSKLQVFTLGDQDKEIYVNFDGLPLPPLFQLKVLSLVQCNLNNVTRRIPDFLLSQKELRELDLSSNNLVGMFPNWLLDNNRHLVFLILRNNSFKGSFLGDGTVVLQDLRYLDIADNEVSGQVPQDIGLFFPSLDVFNLSRNCFHGNIPESLASLKMVTTIDLSHNNFSGEVPDQIGIGCVYLEELILSNNSLHGHFLSGSMNLTYLTVLSLDRNHFVGSISHGLSHSSNLWCLDISNNEFQGKIPSWIGNFSLLVLDLSGNILEGTIPGDICKLGFLQFLDLSRNGLNGSILSCSTLSSLTFLHLEWNQFTGSIPNALVNGSKNLITLDFRYNHLSGGIPHDITTLTELEVLLMGGNDLQGSIPVFICRLKNLNIMDLSQNNFFGRIPACLNGISFGNRNFTSPEFTKWNEGGKYSFADDGFSFSSPLVVFHWKEEVQFRTKSITGTYTGDILNYMSGIDLSGNQLTGEIPLELGDLSHLRALNLSHNYLQGSIPSRLSMLNLIESMDLSYNNLSGQIPYELSNLHFLSSFNVSYNNLSGKTPDQGQFATFDENNYKGNIGLCGPLLQQHCKEIIGKFDSMQDDGNEYQNNRGIDTVAFFWSFFVSFGTALATLSLSLYLSPQYRRVWFGLIDVWILFRFYRWYRSHYQ